MVHVSDLENEPDKFSGVRTSSLVIARLYDSSEEEEEMALNRKKGLKELLTERNKGSASKGAPQSQPFPTLPLPPSPLVGNLLLMPNLKKKRKEKEGANEGKVVPKRNPSSRRWPKTKGGPPQLKVRRPNTRPTCAIQLGTPGWSWMAQWYPRIPLSGSSRKVTPITWSRL